MDVEWDCVVVGGGAAGLSAALLLGRARRRVLLVDSGAQSNLAAHGIGGLLGHDGRPPTELYAMGREELAAYPSVEVRTGEVVDGERSAGSFELRLADGTTERTRRVLLATGMQYRPPELPGLAELWGGSVFHCPFCHGWEVRDQPLGVLADGERAVHMALLLRYWSDDVVVLTSGADKFDDAQRRRLSAAGVRIEPKVVRELAGRDGRLEAVVFDDGSRLPRTGLLVATTLHQRSSLASRLGVVAGDPTPVAQDPVAVEAMYQTNVPGVFAAGDLSALMPQVAAAVAAGSGAAAAVMQSLLTEDHPLIHEGNQHVNV